MLLLFLLLLLLLLLRLHCGRHGGKWHIRNLRLFLEATRGREAVSALFGQIDSIIIHSLKVRRPLWRFVSAFDFLYFVPSRGPPPRPLSPRHNASTLGVERTLYFAGLHALRALSPAPAFIVRRCNRSW